MTKKKRVTYTDMAIWVDANILKPDVNEAKAFKYLRNLAYMLSMKKKYFRNYEDYGLFADYMATIVYLRMTTERQFLPEDDPKYQTPIKSCLNYMKGILYARKVAYEHEFYRQTTNSVEDFSTARDYYESNITTHNSELLEIDVELYLSKISSIIKRILNEGPYSKNRLLYFRLYTSILLSLLRNFTLSNRNKERLEKRGLFSIDKEWKDRYDILINQVIEDEGLKAAMTFELDDKYLDYIEIVMQRVKKDIVDDIKELVREYTLPDQLVEDMLMSGLNTGDRIEI